MLLILLYYVVVHVIDQVIEFDNKYSKTVNFVESISMSLHALH